MALIGVGGDTSVMWEVDAESARPPSVYSRQDPKEGKPNRYRQGGTDNTSADAQQYFTVSIEIPNNAAEKTELSRQLQAAANAVNSGKPNQRVSFRLPIEDDKHGGPNPDQIQVGWPSA